MKVEETKTIDTLKNIDYNEKIRICLNDLLRVEFTCDYFQRDVSYYACGLKHSMLYFNLYIIKLCKELNPKFNRTTDIKWLSFEPTVQEKKSHVTSLWRFMRHYLI